MVKSDSGIWGDEIHHIWKSKSIFPLNKHVQMDSIILFLIQVPFLKKNEKVQNKTF